MSEGTTPEIGSQTDPAATPQVPEPPLAGFDRPPPPMFAPPIGAPGYGAPGYGAPGYGAPQPAGFSGTPGANPGQLLQKKAVRTLWIYALVALALAGFLVFSIKNGQRVYGTFGLVIAIAGLLRSRRTFTVARQLGAPALAGGLRTQAVGAIAVMAVCAIAVVGIQLTEATGPKFGDVASCYAKSGTQVIETSCGSSTATLIGTEIKSNGDDCPADSDGYVERDDKVSFLCLGIKP